MKLKTKLHLKLKYRSILKKLNKIHSKRAVILGTPIHGNIGDLAIAEYETLFLYELGIDVIDIPTELLDLVLESNLIKTSDLLCLHGGGNMGIDYFFEEEIRRKVISTYEKNKIIIFPQTIDYGVEKKALQELEKSIEIYSKHKNLSIYAREEYSYEILTKNFTANHIGLVPDIVLSHQFFNYNLSRDGILLCMRNDIEKTIDDTFISKIKNEVNKLHLHYDVTDTSSPKYVAYNKRKLILENKLKQFSRYKVIITDRLHGMIFAFLTKTPCIVYSNSNNKIRGVYEKWLSDVSYIEFESDNSIESFRILIKTILNKSVESKENMLKNKFAILSKEILDWKEDK